MNSNHFINLQETAKRLGVNRKTLSVALKQHEKTPGVVRVGAQWRINWSVLLAAIDAGEVDLSRQPAEASRPS